MKRTHLPSIIILWSIIYFSAIVSIFSFSKKYLIIKACEKFLSSRDVKCFCFLDSSKISELKINGCSIPYVSPSLLFQCPFITSLLLQTKSGKRNNVIFNTLGKIYIYSSDIPKLKWKIIYFDYHISNIYKTIRKLCIFIS